MDVRPMVSVIIVSYNVQEFLDLCLDAVVKSLGTNISHEIFVVDNNSNDHSIALVEKKYPQVRIIANKENLGFSKANNQALELSTGKYVHFLNPDTIVCSDYYEKSIAYLEAHPDTGAIGPRLIDADGKYAKDSKKSFPSFWVSVAKVLGLSKAFPSSSFFNKYYAAHVGEYETAQVDILSGCCMLVNKNNLLESGGGFDEIYFMYCEDVDMCHRLHLQGFKNIYYPEVTVLHYKGESTRKLTYSYMKIFYEAHAIFVNKYYPQNLGTIYNLALKSVLSLRNLFNVLKYIFLILKIYILDAIIICSTLITFKYYWFEQVHNQTLSSGQYNTTIPIFTIIWMLSLYLNGAYDKPYSLYRAGRGMLMGTILALAFYGLLPLEFRNSRAVILFSGILSTVVLLLSRSIFAYFGIIDLVPRGKNDYKSIIVSDPKEVENIKRLLEENNYKHHIEGIVSIEKTTEDKQIIGHVKDIALIQKSLAINEIILSAQHLDYSSILNIIQTCKDKSSYKIIPGNSKYFISSKNSKNLMDIYDLSNMNIASPINKRNKRIIDILLSCLTLALAPYLLIKHKSTILSAAFKVLFNKNTWVGYSTKHNNKNLPKIKDGIYSPIVDKNIDKIPQNIKERIDMKYAKEYNILDDVQFYLKNIFS